MVGLHPYNTWKSGLTKQELIEKMSRRYAELPGVHVGFAQPISDMVLEKVAGAHSDLVVKVYGNDFKESRRIAVRCGARAQNRAGGTGRDHRPGTAAAAGAHQGGSRFAAARFGINVADIADLMGTGIGGKPVAQLFIEERHYDIACAFCQ